MQTIQNADQIGNSPVALKQSMEAAQVHILAITDDIDAVCDFRVLHDKDLAAFGQTRRSTLREAWPWLCAMNNEGWGVFMVVAALDGEGQKMDNVQHLRACYLDLDGQDAQQQYDLARQAYPPPTFAVCSSPSKYHVYWATAPFADRARFTTVQRKLAALFHGDRKVIDATRVMRLAGTFHMKTDTPTLVTCRALAGYGQRTTLEALETALAGVTVLEGGEGTRKALGDGEQAPSLKWLEHALALVDPNELDRDQWLSISSAVKQAGWTLTIPDDLEKIWLDWCARYEKNNDAENRKLWKSIDSTEVDWKTLVKRVPLLRAELVFGANGAPVQTLQASLSFGDNLVTMPHAQQSMHPNDTSEFFVRVAEMVTRPPIFLIDELIETESLATVFGEPASGKSLIAIDMAASVATGHPFHGHAVLSGSVFYIAGEGKNGLRRRFAAWEQLTGQSIDDAPLYASKAAVRLLDGASAAMVTAAIEKLALKCGNPRLIVVDTLARNFGDGDENSQKDMNAFIAALDQLRERFAGSTVLLVHHSGHGDKERARGSSALRGAVDAEYKVAKDGDAVHLTNHKMKDAAPPSPMAFALVSAAGSVALEYTGEPIAKGGKRTAGQSMALSAFDESATDGKATIDAWRNAFFARRKGSVAAKVRAFNRGKAWTIEERILQSDDGVNYEKIPMPGQIQAMIR